MGYVIKNKVGDALTRLVVSASGSVHTSWSTHPSEPIVFGEERRWAAEAAATLVGGEVAAKFPIEKFMENAAEKVAGTLIGNLEKATNKQ
jgi:hypothetical protein